MDEKTVKQRIKAYRKQSKLSQKEIADQIGISRNAYIGIENGDTRIFNEKLQKIAELTDTTIEKLVLGYEPVENAEYKLGEAKMDFDEKYRRLQEDYEARIREKDDTIALLKKLVDSLQESLKSSGGPGGRLRRGRKGPHRGACLCRGRHTAAGLLPSASGRFQEDDSRP